MTSAVQLSTSTKDTGHLDLGFKLPKPDFSTHYLVHSLDPSKLTPRDSLTDTSNTVHYSTTPPLGDTFVDHSLSLLSCSDSTVYLGRVATVDRHDIDAWTRERKVHDSELNTVAVSSSLGSNGTAPDDFCPVNVAKSSFVLMELQTEGPRTVEQCSNTGWLGEGAAAHSHDFTPLVALGPGGSPLRPNVPTRPYWREDLSGDRCRVGEILVHCGAINVSGMLPIEPATVGCGGHTLGACLGACPVDAPVISHVTAELLFSENESLVTALAEWTSEWVHTLVIEPYLRGNFRFQYQGKPSRASTLVALRIRRVLGNVENPVQVAIHALWFIGTLTGNPAHDNVPFLSVPIFRYLHNNGTFVAEDFMFRTFATCAMIGDKAVNDATLSINTWNRLTHIPQVILNATEKYALSYLKWNVVMNRIQWQDTITYLRSCVNMSSSFDPFSYEGTSPSGVMARYLDELINLSHMEETYTSQQELSALEILASQPIRHFAPWEVFGTTEWCPEHDPVINQKPRTVGIAPGTDQSLSTLKVGTTAKDLLDSILGSSGVPDLAHLAQPAGTSFCGSFGVIGARLAHTLRIASGCQSTAWVPSHG